MVEQGEDEMITKESKPGQSVALIELEEDGYFVEVRQEEDNLTVIIPPDAAHQLNLKRFPGSFIVFFIICGILVLFFLFEVLNKYPFPFKIYFLIVVLVPNTLLIDAVLDFFGKTTLRFSRTHLRIKRQYIFYRFSRRISLKQVGEVRGALCDDLHTGPEDVVTIPLGKNDYFNIHSIKAFEDEKYLVNVINTFLTQIRGK